MSLWPARMVRGLVPNFVTIYQFITALQIWVVQRARLGVFRSKYKSNYKWNMIELLREIQHAYDVKSQVGCLLHTEGAL